MNDDIHKGAKLLNEKISHAMEKLGELAEHIDAIFEFDKETEYEEVENNGMHVMSFEGMPRSSLTEKVCNIYRYNGVRYMLTSEHYISPGFTPTSGPVKNVYKERIANE